MRKLIIRENKNGHFHVENFGSGFAGAHGKESFALYIDCPSHHFTLEIPEATAFDLVTKLDLRSPEFQGDKIRIPNFIKVRVDKKELVLEASTGTFYDFLKESVAKGCCEVQSPFPVAFYWQGNVESEAA
jgi:hypothetical protein